MPRLARLDAVGLLQHVMVRGIEKRDIFLDDNDRKHFVDRLSRLLLKTETACLAWCLMNNHFHLLLRLHKTKLSFFMRRLLTGYAVTFNLRHERVGHLFQNRYKSIVCEEETYLLELIRYIHLNPVRTGQVVAEDGLRKYQWSGHTVLMGDAELAGQVPWEVLSRFGDDLLQAREKYRKFVMEGFDEGRRDKFGCGGLLSSPFLMPSQRGEESCDSRVLGSGDFVEELWASEEQEVPEPRMSLPHLLQEVSSWFQIEVNSLCHPNKNRRISEARAVTCYLAVRELGYTGVAIAKTLGITSAAVTLAADRGEAVVKRENIRKLLQRPLRGG